MIITKLVGGLGNQMFQYACGYSVAKKNNTNLSLDTSWYIEKNSVVWTMTYELDRLNISYKKILNKYPLVNNKNHFINGFRKHYLPYIEKSMVFDDSIFSAGSNIVLDGYWQSEKYFIDYKTELQNEFTPINQIENDYLKQINDALSVSLHVRRGDYANHKQTNNFHGLMSLEYYNSAISLMQSRLGDRITIFIFSDDIEWCKQNIKTTANTIYVTGNDGLTDMQLMAACQNNIIANSSFSWWGAWLNRNPNKIVVAPDKWFNDPKPNTKDIIPRSWERIKR
jgi:hypothetical protein